MVICLFSGCPPSNEPAPYYKDWVIVHGKVTITRNGIPWDSGKYLLDITALDEKDRYVGSSDHLITWLGNGVYRWDVYIFKGYMFSGAELPYKINFRVSCQMDGINPQKITNEFLVKNGTSVNLGTINYDIARLHGNLPIKVNGEAVNNISGASFESVIITIRLPDGTWLLETKIQPNGDWSSYIEKLATDTELLCRIRAYKKGGGFEKILPNMMYYVNNDDIEFNFPGYPDGVDFEAITLSGTIKMLIQNEQPKYGYVMFYLDGRDDTDQIGNRTVQYLQPNGDGSAKWDIMLPAFSFPRELLVLVTVEADNVYYQKWSSVDITSDTDLSNIDLGVFTE